MLCDALIMNCIIIPVATVYNHQIVLIVRKFDYSSIPQQYNQLLEYKT